jgi:hypothetical protein
MFIQRMLTALAPGGIAVVVISNGVLFRNHSEGAIRRQVIENDQLEAVIGLPPGLFHGNGVPVCLLVLRAKGAKPPERQGKVLFIDASQEYDSGRSGQNFLRSKHITKILLILRAFQSIDRRAAVRNGGELAAEEWNLNVPRHVDTFVPEPHKDLQALLTGGVPTELVNAQQGLFDWLGLPITAVFSTRPDGYYDFPHAAETPGALGDLVASYPGVLRSKQAKQRLIDLWWQKLARPYLASRAGAGSQPLVNPLLASLDQAIGLMALLAQKLNEDESRFDAWWQANEQEFLAQLIAAQADDQAIKRVPGWLEPDNPINVFDLYFEWWEEIQPDLEAIQCAEDTDLVRPDLPALSESQPLPEERWERIKACLDRLFDRYHQAAQATLVGHLKIWFDEYGISLEEMERRLKETKAQMNQIFIELGLRPPEL